jgi:6-phosphofructokinase
LTQESAAFFQRNRDSNIRLRIGNERQEIESRLDAIENEYADNTNLLSHVLHQKTGLDTRITILGFLLRGGVPSSIDRMRATQFGTNCVAMIDQSHFGVMLRLNNFQIESIPLIDVAAKHKPLPTDHIWLQAARKVGTCFGD